MINRAFVAVAALTMTLAGASTAQAASPPTTGHVYQATNDANGNRVAVYDQGPGGTLRAHGTVGTGGLGTGASLASQGGLVRDGQLLFVVNAGDNTISSLTTGRGDSLRLRDRIPSGGDRPVSISVRDGVGYVLNHNSDTIVGFRYSRSGDLRLLPHSTRRLTANQSGGLSDAAQVQFSPDGDVLAVTEKASNTIDTFPIDRGLAGRAHPHPSAGMVPYGFDFDHRGTLVVSEAATGSASSYRATPRFHTITAAVANGQAAACWVVVSGRYAWVVNAASNSVSSYRIHGDGSLTLTNPVAGTTPAGPTEAAVAPDGRSLYVRLGDGSVQSFRIGHHGSLTATGTASVTTNHGIAGLAAD